MIHLYGWDAEAEAAQRSNTLADMGDIEGCRLWGRVAQAIGALTRKRALVH